MDRLEKAILKYLESRPEDWKWVMGNKVLNKKETISLFMKDKEFRKKLKTMVEDFAVEMFLRSSEKQC